MKDITYGFQRNLGKIPFDEAVERATAALQEQGFGVLTEIDVKATLKKKLDAEFRPYKILGACNPKLARQALQAEPQIGLLLPCNVVVQQAEGGDVIVSFADPGAMFQIVKNPELERVAGEVTDLIRRIADAV